MTTDPTTQAPSMRGPALAPACGPVWALLRRILPSLAAFAILVPTLTLQSIWWDEGISMHLAASPWGAILDNRASNIHPPLYFLLLSGWTWLVGATPFAARYLSALALTLLPAAVNRFVGRRWGQRAGRAAALMVALAPPLIIYGQEVRAYALLPLLTVALLSYLWPVAGAPRFPRSPRQIAGLAAVQVALITLHYAGVLAVGLANLVWLVRCVYVALCGDGPRRVKRLSDESAADGTRAAPALTLRGGGPASPGGGATRGPAFRRTIRRCRGWVIASIATLLALVPWGVLVARAGPAGMRRQAGLGNALAAPVPAGYVARMLGIFHVVGLPTALGDSWLRQLSALVGAVLALSVVWVVMRLLLPGDSGRTAHGRLARQVGALLAVWLLPFVVAPAVWIASPQAHPRYFLPFILGAWLLAGVLVAAPSLWRALRLGLLAAVLTASVAGLFAYFVSPAYARSDVRAAAAYVRDHARAGDVVVVPYTDWSLPQYDLAPARAVMVPDPADDAAVAATLFAEVPAGAQVFALDYPRDALDPRGQVRAMLAWSGTLVDRHEVHGAFIEIHEMASAPQLPACAPRPPLCAGGTDLCLTGVAVDDAPMSGAAVPVRLCWSGDPGGGRYAAALRLVAPAGVALAAQDELLLDVRLRPTELWSADGVSTFHVVPVPVAAAPMPHTVELALYDTQDPARAVLVVDEDGVPRPTAPVAEVTPALEPWFETSLYLDAAMPEGPVAELTEYLSLTGAAADREEIRPGQDLVVTVCERATASSPAPASTPAQVELRQAAPTGVGASTLVTAPLRVDAASVPAGRPWCEHVALRVPTEVESGPATVVLIPSEAAELPIAEVRIEAEARLFEPPAVPYEVRAQVGDVATLIGFDLHPGAELTVGAPVTLTLVWRAEDAASATDLKVFTHLTAAEGTRVGQHDAKPAQWTRPTSGWVAGEIIIDEHPVDWIREDVTGPASLRVGLYDGETGATVPWRDGAHGFELPLALTLTAAD